MLHRSRALPGAGLWQRGGRGVHRGPCTERVARCSCATTWRYYGTNIVAACSAVQSKIICSISSWGGCMADLARKISLSRMKVWLSKNYLVCAKFSLKMLVKVNICELN